MEFTPDQIRKVAKLAKIRLTDTEISIFSEQFVSISQIIKKLQQVDTINITPINNPSQAYTLMREDIISDGNYVENILINAPRHAFNCFIVPKVVE